MKMDMNNNFNTEILFMILMIDLSVSFNYLNKLFLDIIIIFNLKLKIITTM